jgi:major membrane immunogen (membrane-anchored lipoprotein)
MKTSNYLIIVCLVTLSFLAYSFNDGKKDTNINIEYKDSSNTYLDGTYLGQSQSRYTAEPFWGHIQITVDNGSFGALYFIIRDSNLHETVDSMYGVVHYAGYPVYQQQCVNDAHGIEIYPQNLLKSQDLDNVDAITGATWSYNIFIASAKAALKDAKIITGIDNRIETDKVSIYALPNPFNSTLTLEYNLTKNSYVALDIYDSQGKLLKKLVDKEQEPGIYTIQWQECSTSGIYYYRLQTDNVVISRKLIALK